MKNLLLFLSFCIVLSSCKQTGGNTDSNQSSEKTSVDQENLTKNGITLTEVVSPSFEDATLKLKTPQQGTQFLSGVGVFAFDVENYELGSQTEDAETKSCANSAKGQHIHLILNNAPYSAHYESSFNRELEDGNYVGLAFLSRSYHESVKSASAYQVFTFSSGEASEPIDFDPATAHLFYSRPKGTYEGDDIKKVLLDFYLINSELSVEGYKVKATINGSEFMLYKWVPYAMEGLPEGENTIELALLDANGELVKSPFNPVTRTVMLTQ